MLTPCQCGKVVNVDVDLGETCIYSGVLDWWVGLSNPSV